MFVLCTIPHSYSLSFLQVINLYKGTLNLMNFFAGSCIRKTISLDSESLSEHRIRRNEHSSYSVYVTTAGQTCSIQVSVSHA
jgi:hypothetical protein